MTQTAFRKIEAGLKDAISHAVGPSYLALIEYEPAATAWGLVVPDLPGCTAMGQTREEALSNGVEAAEEWARDIAAEVGALPRARTEAELRADPSLADDFTPGTEIVALQVKGGAHVCGLR